VNGRPVTTVRVAGRPAQQRSPVLVLCHLVHGVQLRVGPPVRCCSYIRHRTQVFSLWSNLHSCHETAWWVLAHQRTLP
jgi:hypothetical protein